MIIDSEVEYKVFFNKNEASGYFIYRQTLRPNQHFS